MKIRLKALWFDKNAVRRKPGIIYTLPDSRKEELPSGTEVLDDLNQVIEVVNRPKKETKEVTTVEVVTDTDAKTEVSKDTKVVSDGKLKL